MPLRRSALVAILAIPLLLTACSGDDQDTTPTTTSSAAASSTTSTTPSTTSSTTPEETEPVTEDQAAVEPEPEVAASYVVECLPDPPGPATWSDGTVRFSQDCYDQGVANRGAYQCPGTDSYVDDLSLCGNPQGAPDPATVPYAEGGTCAAAVCGYGYDEYGNRNPSSGEIQGRHLCQDGYIDDPEYCAAIEDVFANNVDYRDWE